MVGCRLCELGESLAPLHHDLNSIIYTGLEALKAPVDGPSRRYNFQLVAQLTSNILELDIAKHFSKGPTGKKASRAKVYFAHLCKCRFPASIFSNNLCGKHANVCFPHQKGVQIDYLIQTRFNTLFVCEIKFSRPSLDKNIISEVQNKINAISKPHKLACIPILIHVNGVDDSVIEKGYFMKIFNFGSLLENG
jgi:hypothetical protein